MAKHICQGPKCHTYDTQSRIRGTKGAKVLRTRTARYDMNEWISKKNEKVFCYYDLDAEGYRTASGDFMLWKRKDN